MRASEGLALKKSGAELPCLDLNLSLERKESYLPQLFERGEGLNFSVRVINGPKRKISSIGKIVLDRLTQVC